VEFTHICKIDRSYLGEIERGVQNISVLNLAKLAHPLLIPNSELFSN